MQLYHSLSLLLQRNVSSKLSFKIVKYKMIKLFEEMKGVTGKGRSCDVILTCSILVVSFYYLLFIILLHFEFHFHFNLYL